MFCDLSCFYPLDVGVMGEGEFVLEMVGDIVVLETGFVLHDFAGFDFGLFGYADRCRWLLLYVLSRGVLFGDVDLGDFLLGVLYVMVLIVVFFGCNLRSIA